MTNKKVSDSVPSLKSRGMKAPRPGAGVQASDEEVRKDDLKSDAAMMNPKPADAEGRPDSQTVRETVSSKPAKRAKAMRSEAEWCDAPKSHEEPRMKQDRH